MAGEKEIWPDLTKEELRLFQEFIEKNSGIHLDETKHDSLRISLSIRVSQRGLGNYQKYYQFLNDHPQGEEEFKELLNMITINETCFFRNPPQFAALKEWVLPEIIKRKEATERTIRIWSAGCSTGEEPYSIAMVLLDVLEAPETWNIEILGTDVSKRALILAKEAIYNKRSVRLIDKEHLNKYFKKHDQDEYKLADNIKGMVDFGYHNLIKEPYALSVMKGWDIIFCRNVTIYFKLESVRRVIHNFYQSLNEGGYLFVGHSETLRQISRQFVPVEARETFVYKKEKQGAKERKGLDKVELKAKSPLRKKPSEEENERRKRLKFLYQRALEHCRKDEWEKVLEEAEKILEMDSQNLQAHLLKGKVYANQEKDEEAIKACLKAVEVNPLLASGHFLLGVLYNKRGRREEAISEFKKTVYLDKSFALAYFNLANIYKSQGKGREADREYSRTLGSLRESPSGEWQEFSGGYVAEFLMEICKRALADRYG